MWNALFEIVCLNIYKFKIITWRSAFLLSTGTFLCLTLSLSWSQYTSSLCCTVSHTYPCLVSFENSHAVKTKKFEPRIAVNDGYFDAW